MIGQYVDGKRSGREREGQDWDRSVSQDSRSTTALLHVDTLLTRQSTLTSFEILTIFWSIIWSIPMESNILETWQPFRPP